MENKQQRNSSIELLRIIAMLFIITSHLRGHSGLNPSELPLTANKIFLQWGDLGQLGVVIFVIITGYFLSTKTFSVKRLSSLFSQVWFYSLIIGAISIFVLNVNAGIMDIIKVIFPTVLAEYWFFTAYTILMLLSPFINILITNLDRSKFFNLIICMIILWVIIPTFTLQEMYGSRIIQFTLFYLIGAYFQKYPDNCFSKKKIRLLCALVCLILLLLSNVCIEIVAQNLFSEIGKYRGHFYERYSLLIVGLAVGLFTTAIYSKPFTNKFVNQLSACTFGVYLIHDNFLFRQILWTRIFNISEIYQSPFFVIQAIAIVLTVFSACAIIEFVRLKTIATPLSNIVERFLQAIKQRFFTKT